jgi:hypothetical protein
MPLKSLGGFLAATLLAWLRKNNEVLSQTLSELSMAG